MRYGERRYRVEAPDRLHSDLSTFSTFSLRPSIQRTLFHNQMMVQNVILDSTEISDQSRFSDLKSVFLEFVEFVEMCHNVSISPNLNIMFCNVGHLHLHRGGEGGRGGGWEGRGQISV